MLITFNRNFRTSAIYLCSDYLPLLHEETFGSEPKTPILQQISRIRHHSRHALALRVVFPALPLAGDLFAAAAVEQQEPPPPFGLDQPPVVKVAHPPQPRPRGQQREERALSQTVVAADHQELLLDGSHGC